MINPVATGQSGASGVEPAGLGCYIRGRQENNPGQPSLRLNARGCDEKIFKSYTLAISRLQILSGSIRRSLGIPTEFCLFIQVQAFSSDAHPFYNPIIQAFQEILYP